jgi:Uma2 family endonuclease
MQYDAAMSETKLVSAEELLAMGKGRRELVRGQVLEFPYAEPRHSRIGVNVGTLLWQFVKREGLGTVYGADTGFLLERAPDTVRAPDAAFVAEGRLEGVDERKYLPLAPDLAVEVVSPSDSPREVEERAAMWISFGTRLVWVVEPELEKAFVYRPGVPRKELSRDEELDGGEVLPGLVIPLAECF